MKIHIVLFLIVVIACQNSHKSTEKKLNDVADTISSGKTQDKLSKPLFDISTHKITNDNLIEFLTWYAEINQDNYFVVTTSLGDFEIELFVETPLHRANFAFLVERKYYSTTYFHRVVKDFVVQAGNSDLMSTSKQRKSIGHYKLPFEYSAKHKHHYGYIGAARRWEDNPNKESDPYEFYVVTSKSGSYHLDKEHTVFGKVISGFETIQKINQEDIGDDEMPLRDVKIFDIKPVKK